MVYGRKYFSRKRYYSRSRNYRKRVLGNRNIYANRSSRNQAVQIAALRNRVNRVYKVCKPETKVVFDSDVDKDFSNSAFSSTWVSWNPAVITSGPADNQRIGDKVYRRDIYKLVLTYSNDADDKGGLHNNESSCALCRVVCGMWKEPKGQYSLPTPDSIINNWGTSASHYNVNCIQPLINGVTTEHKIFYDKTFKVTLNDPIQLVSVKTPFYQSRYDALGNHVHSWLMVITGDLDWDSEFTETLECHGIRKTVFKDN